MHPRSLATGTDNLWSNRDTTPSIISKWVGHLTGPENKNLDVINSTCISDLDNGIPFKLRGELEEEIFDLYFTDTKLENQCVCLSVVQSNLKSFDQEEDEIMR